MIFFFLVHYKCDLDDQIQALLFKLHFSLRHILDFLIRFDVRDY